MGLFRRRRVEEELLELVRTELGTIRGRDPGHARRDRGRPLDPGAHRDRAADGRAAARSPPGIQSVRDTIGARDAELAHVLKRVIETCDTLSQRVAARPGRADRARRGGRPPDRRGLLGRDLRPRRPRPTGRDATVVGGTVDPTPPADATSRRVGRRSSTGPPDEIDLEPRPRVDTDVPTRPLPARPVRPDGVEVRCRFGDRWVTGFEVCEVIRLDDATRYRLRRRSDGSVIPTLFDEKDLRFFSTTFVEPDWRQALRRTPARPASSGRSRYVLIPGSASHTYGIAFTQCIAGAISPISGCSPTTGGCRPWNVTASGGSPSNSTSNRCPSSAPRRVEVLLAHEPVHAHGDHRLAVDQPLPREPLRRDRPGLEHADRRVEVASSRRPSRASCASPRRASSRARPRPCRSTA